jgi:hypothetical protein
MLRLVRAFFLVTAALGLSAGCSSSNRGGQFEVAPDNGERFALVETGELLRNRMLDTGKPARSLADLARYENAGPTAFNKIQKGEIVVVWSTNPKEGASANVLAYEKQTPQSGGFVLMEDGTTVKKMSPAEFQAASKVGAVGSTGAAGKPK